MKSDSSVLQPTLGGLAGERCPWCDQPISREKFDEIRGRIQADERDRVADLERRLKEEVAKEKEKADARAEAEINAVRIEAAAALDALDQKTAAKMQAAVDETKKATEAAMASKVAEAEQARRKAEGQLEVARANHEEEVNRRLLEQRGAMEKAQSEAVNAERAKNFEERLKLEQNLEQMKRQLQSKTSSELGEGAEVDLFEALKDKFPEDDIRRVGKGKEGADILQEVQEGGKHCGSIVYDSKNRNAWRNDYVTKLRADQLAAKADHALLATEVLPAGARQIHLQDGVIVLNPARAVVVAEILRNQIVQMHALRLSGVARADKMARLYEFIASDRWTQLMDQIETETEHMLELDVKEVKAHEANWKRRGQLIRSVQRLEGELTAEVDRIVGGPVVVRGVQEV